MVSHFEVQLSWFLRVSFSKPLPLTLLTRPVSKYQLGHVGKSVFSLPPGCTPHCLSPIAFKSPFLSCCSDVTHFLAIPYLTNCTNGFGSLSSYRFLLCPKGNNTLCYTYAFSVCSEPRDNWLLVSACLFICTQSERSGRVLTTIMETLLLSGNLFYVYILNCILINHLVQFKTRAGLA